MSELTPVAIIYDETGTNAASVKGASTAPVATDKALVVTVSPNSSATTTGSKTNNSVAPGSTNLGVLPAVATSAAPSYTDGYQVAVSTTLGGSLRVDNTSWLGSTAPTVGSKTSANSVPVVIASDQGAVSISGTVTSNIGTTNGLALDSTLAKLTVAQGTALGANTQALAGASVTTAAPTYTTGQISPLSLTTAGALRTDASGTTQPVSGTVTANVGTTNGLALDATLSAQSLVDNAAFTDGTSRVQASGYILDEVAGTALTENDVAAARIDSKRAQVFVVEDATTRGQRATVSAAGAVKVDGSAVTQPISGTVTANAGTNLNTSALALDATVGLTQGSTTSGQKGPLIQGAVTTAAPTYTTAQTNPLSLTTAGALRVDSSGSTQPVSGTVTANQGGTWSNRLLDGYGNQVSSATSNPTGTETGLIVRNIPSGTQAVSGTITANIGTTNGLALDSTLAKLTISQGTALGTNTQALAGGSVTTAAPTYTTGQISPLSLTTAGALRTDASGTTQPISAASLPLPTGAATSANQTTVGSQTTKINDGTSTAAVKAASTAAIATDPALVVAISPNNTVAENLTQIAGSSVTTVATGTLKVGIADSAGNAFLSAANALNSTGTGVQAAQVVGQFDDTAPTAITENQFGNLRMSANRNLYGTIRDAAGNERGANVTAGNALVVDGSAATQPVSGTVTANQGGTWSNRLLDGYGNQISSATSNPVGTETGLIVRNIPSGTQAVSGTLTANIGTTNGLALDSSITAQSVVDNAAFTDGTTRVQPVGFILDEVAGTALTENDTAAARIDSKRAIINVIEDATTRGQRASVSAAGAVKVDGSAVTQPVSGTITANAGTNLNTSALALDATLAKLTIAQGATLGTNTQALAGGSVTTAAPTYTTGQISPLSLTTAGLLRVDASGTTIDTELPAAATIAADGVTPTVPGVAAYGFIKTPGANTWDRHYSIVNATNSTGTGIAAAGLVAQFDDTTPTAITENQFGNVRMSANRNLYSTLRDAAGNERGANVTAGNALVVDGSAVNQPVLGTKTNNNAAPGATNVGALTSLANAAAPTFTEGNLVTLSSNLAGSLRTDNTSWLGSTAPTVGSKTSANSVPVVIASDQASVGVKATSKPLYGTNNQALTITLASLTTGSARASTAVSNTTNLFEDVLFFVKTTSAAAATSATGYVNIYGYGTVDGGTTYPEAITGTDAGPTLSAPPNLVLLAQITVNANAKTYTAGPFSFCRTYGLDRLPDHWGLVFVNQSGATLNATAGNHAITYQGVNGEIV